MDLTRHIDCSLRSLREEERGLWLRGKKRSHGLSPSFMSMHPAQCLQMFCWTSVLKLLLDFRELPVCAKDSNGRNPKARPQYLSYFSRPCNNILRPQKPKKVRKFLSENRKAIGGSHRTRVLQAFRVTSKLPSDQGRRGGELFRHSRKLTRSLFLCAAQWMRNGR